MGFLPTDNIKGAVISENFLSNVENLIKGTVIHHSHITGEAVGYAHSFCNLRSEKIKIKSAWSHTIFSVLIFSFS